MRFYVSISSKISLLIKQHAFLLLILCTAVQSYFTAVLKMKEFLSLTIQAIRFLLAYLISAAVEGIVSA